MIKLLVLLITLTTLLFAGEGYIVITNSGCVLLASADAQQLFIGRKANLPSNERVVLAVLESGAAHESFMSTVVGRRPDQFVNHWKQQVFTGKGVMPASFATDKELIAFVAKSPGALGYISTESKGGLPAGVTIVEIK